MPASFARHSVTWAGAGRGDVVMMPVARGYGDAAIMTPTIILPGRYIIAHGDIDAAIAFAAGRDYAGAEIADSRCAEAEPMLTAMLTHNTLSARDIRRTTSRIASFIYPTDVDTHLAARRRIL